MTRRLFGFCLGMFLWAALPIATGAYGMTAKDLYPQEISAEVLRQRAEEFIDEMMLASGDTRRYTVELVHVPKSLRAPEGSVRFSPSLPYGLRYWGNTAVYMDVFVDEVQFRRVKCQFKLHIFENVAVAAKPLVPGTPLTAADFRFEEQEVGTRSKNLLTDAGEIIGKVVSRPVSIGMPILRSMLKQPDILKAGAPVTLVSKRNGIEVKMDGIALEGGHEGEIIRVKNAASRKVLRGRILDEYTVEIVRK